MKSLIALAGLLSLATAAAAQDVDRIDTNHDGQITRAEFAAARMANFARFDRNGDGVVSAADIPAIARFRPSIQKTFQNFIANADANGDGVVTRAELANAPMPVFDRADANHDGVIDRSEMATLRAGLAQMRNQ
ncbi:EF-hand domain-containing protein [Sphingomonas echinoides]|uniref:Dockerin type I domain-containing protein n=1 Tax=Sphingomonas echinoides TaxID=59803 RepID=A0ABU4PMS8_9SPHN|nr:dockerin type I domain-containing protein [Sphingomonas echinoides]MDX5985458.1 dockerin type I domain-containing protein [Sphingomonas echinoides]